MAKIRETAKFNLAKINPIKVVFYHHRENFKKTVSLQSLLKLRQPQANFLRPNSAIAQF